MKAMSTVKEKGKKLDPFYAVAWAFDEIASEAEKGYIMNKQLEECFPLFENFDDAQVSLISFYICEILNRACVTGCRES